MENTLLNLIPAAYLPEIHLSQYDIGRTITFTLKDGASDYSVPSGASVKVKATKPSGFGFEVACTFNGGTVTLVTTDTMTPENGRFPAELSIVSGNTTIGTSNFIFNIERSPHPEGTIDGDAETIIPELTLLVERVESAASSVLDMQVVANTLPAGSQASYSYDEELNKATFGIPQGEAGSGAVGTVASAYDASKTYAVGDYAIHNNDLYRCITAITTAEAFTASHWTKIVLADDVTDLKTDFNALSVGKTFAFDLNTTWAQGGVNSGGEYSSWSRIRTDYINIEELGEITLIPAEGYALLYVVYDSNKAYTKTGGWLTDSVTIPLDNTEKYVRVCFRKDPEANLSPSAGSNLTATAIYRISNNVEESNTALKEMTQSIIDGLSWEIGGISDGANYNTTLKIRTSTYVDVTRYSHLTAIAESGYKFSMAFYDSSKNYLFTLPSGGYVTGSNVISLDDKIAFVRVNFATSDDATQSDTSISSNFTLKYDWKLVGKVKTLKHEQTNLIEGATWIRGTVDKDGEVVSSTSRVVLDDYISVSGIESLNIHPLTNAVKYSVHFFGAFGKLGASTQWHTGDSTVIIPPNVTKIKMTASVVPDAWIGDATLGKSLRVYAGQLKEFGDGNVLIKDYFCATSVNKKEIPTLASGTTILAFGDSITAGDTDTSWTYHFADMTGCTFINKAIGGSTYGESETEDSGHWISTQIGNVSASDWSSADLVVIAMGTNDYGHGTPLDELKTKVQGAITAIKAETDVPIVVITPIRRGLILTDDPMKKLPLISGIIANVALANECNVINGFDIPLPTYNIDGLIDDMTRDGLHPVAIGANVYARSIVNALI